MGRVDHKKCNYREGGNKMLKVNAGCVEFQGTKVFILSEVTTLIHALLETSIDKDDILYAVDLATKSDEELDAEIKMLELDKKIAEKQKEQKDLEIELKELFKSMFGD